MIVPPKRRKMAQIAQIILVVFNAAICDMIQLHLLTTAIIEVCRYLNDRSNGLRFLFKNVQEYHRISQGILGPLLSKCFCKSDTTAPAPRLCCAESVKRGRTSARSKSRASWASYATHPLGQVEIQEEDLTIQDGFSFTMFYQVLSLECYFQRSGFVSKSSSIWQFREKS